MNRLNWYYRFQPDTDWLSDFQDEIDESQRNIVLALTEDQGVRDGFEVTERGAGQNFSIDIAAGLAFDTAGRRISNAAVLNVPLTLDIDGQPIQVETSTFDRVVAVFLRYTIIDDTDSAATDGFGDPVFTRQIEAFDVVFVQGAEASSGTATPPAHPGTGLVRIAEITITEGDATIADGDIDQSNMDVMTPFVALTP